MSELVVTAHACSRIQQRGIKHSDLELFQHFGERVSDGFVMSPGTVNATCVRLRAVIRRLEKISGRVLITDGPTVITSFKATKAQLRGRFRA
jgi:hypothetical protein